LLPQAKAQYCDRLGVWHIVARAEAASEEGTDSEHLEELGGRADTGHEARRPVALAQYGVALAIQGHLEKPGNPSTIA